VTSSNSQQSSYTTESIQKLEPREHVRKRPGMYIGGTDSRALHHLLWAILDHMTEEAMVGLSHYIHVQLLDNQTVIVESDGTSLIQSAKAHKDVETLFTDLLINFGHRKPMSDMYFGVQGGLHGIGLSIANLLSETFELEITCNGHTYKQTFRQGIASADLDHHPTRPDAPDKTRITFSPDYTIFENNDFDMEVIKSRFKTLSYLIPTVNFQIYDLRDGMKSDCYRSTDGLREWVTHLTADETPICEIIACQAFHDLIDQSGKPYKVGIQFALQFVESDTVDLQSVINTIPTPDGGTHHKALRMAILEKLLNTKSLKLGHKNTGVIGIIHLLHPDPQFEGRIRMKVFNQDVYELVQQMMLQFVVDHPDQVTSLRDTLI